MELWSDEVLLRIKVRLLAELPLFPACRVPGQRLPRIAKPYGVIAS